MQLKIKYLIIIIKLILKFKYNVDLSIALHALLSIHTLFQADE